MQTVKISIVVCDSCKNYRKKHTDHMETFYHCIFDSAKVVRSCIEEVRRSTPRIDEVMLQRKCPIFKRKRE